jgi:hypothetical protein
MLHTFLPKKSDGDESGLAQDPTREHHATSRLSTCDPTASAFPSIVAFVVFFFEGLLFLSFCYCRRASTRFFVVSGNGFLEKMSAVFVQS